MRPWIALSEISGNKCFFGGVTIVLVGDFWQMLSVISKWTKLIKSDIALNCHVCGTCQGVIIANIKSHPKINFQLFFFAQKLGERIVVAECDIYLGEVSAMAMISK